MTNRYKVQRATWARWTPAQRARFNALYPLIRDDQSLFTHPDATAVPAPHWQVTAWNTAFLAASQGD